MGPEKQRYVFKLVERGLLDNWSRPEEPESLPAPEGRNNKLRNGKRLYKSKYTVGKLSSKAACMCYMEI